MFSYLIISLFLLITATCESDFIRGKGCGSVSKVSIKEDDASSMQFTQPCGVQRKTNEFSTIILPSLVDLPKKTPTTSIKPKSTTISGAQKQPDMLTDKEILEVSNYFYELYGSGMQNKTTSIKASNKEALRSVSDDAINNIKGLSTAAITLPSTPTHSYVELTTSSTQTLPKKTSPKQVSGRFFVDDHPNKEIEKEKKLEQFRRQFNMWLDKQRKESEKPDGPEIQIMREGIISRSSQKWTLICTSILIRDGTRIILIDPGLATNSAIKKAYFSKLSSLSMSNEDVTDVIITNGHPDHVTDTNAFPNGVLYQSGMLFWKSTFVLLENGTISVSGNVKIISMSGQASQHLGVIILNCPEYPGIVTVTGDIFMSEKDLTHPYLWQTFSSDIQKQELVRNKIICNSDWIIPGHGNIFPVTRALRLKHCF